MKSKLKVRFNMGENEEDMKRPMIVLSFISRSIISCGKRTLFLILFALVIFTTVIYFMAMSEDKCRPGSITYSICELLKLRYHKHTRMKTRTRISAPFIEPTQEFNAHKVDVDLKLEQPTVKPITNKPTNVLLKLPSRKRIITIVKSNTTTAREAITIITKIVPTTLKATSTITERPTTTTKRPATTTKRPTTTTKIRTTTTKRPATTSPITMEWLDVSEGKKYSDYGDNTCEDNSYRTRLSKILERWIEIATKYDIKYFLMFGSLLGAWRNGDIIPYDSDIDILIDSADTIKLDAIKDKRNFSSTYGAFHLILQEDWKLPFDKRRRFKCDGMLVPSYHDECTFQEAIGRLIKDNLHIDIYDYKTKNGKLIALETAEEYSPDDIFPLKKCNYIGVQTVCPRRPKDILHLHYGSNLAPSKICRNSEWIESK